MRKFLQIIICTVIMMSASHTMLYGQTSKISGHVYDLATGEPLEMANVSIKGTTLGTSTDQRGFFSLEVSGQEEFVLMVSFIGYKNLEIEARAGSTALVIELEPEAILGTEIVISASRMDEKLRETPLTIQKMNIKSIQNPASGDYFGDLTTMRDVEIIGNSIGFKVFNARGFNTTAQLRAVQFIDGIDNQLPTINIVTGNMFGVGDIDLESIEVISGPASAMYGPNAMQGVLSYKTKSPFKYRGVSVMVKGGNQEYGEAQFRYGDVYFKGKLGFKITGSYMTARDWRADDPVYNKYGNQSTPPTDFDAIIQSNAEAGIPVFQAFNDYASQYNAAYPGQVRFMMPGYMEGDLYDGSTENMKVGGGLYYKATKDMMISYEGRYSTGTSVYMGNNRAPLEGFYQMQHVLGFDYKGFSLKGYMSQDNTESTFSMPAAGVLLGVDAAKNVVGPTYLETYMGTIAQLSGGFSSPFDPNWAISADEAAMQAANGQWYQPGTQEFNEAFDAIKSVPPPNGANFQSKTTLYHVEAMYDYSFNTVDLNFGASFRNTNPVSNGTTFSDTSGTTINVAEYGGFAQAVWDAISNKLKVFGSVRLDKSSNYDLQFSPRLALVYNLNEKHVLRLTGQSAFRSPSVSDQYNYLNKGYGFTIGNVAGYSNGYTVSSFAAFAQSHDPNDLRTAYVEGVKPEQLQSIELGYNGLITDKLFLETSLYYNMYSDFITYVTVMTPGSGVAGEESGLDAVMAGNVKPYLVATNSDKDVNTYGVSVGLSYYVLPTLKVYGNYTFSQLDTAGYNKSDDEILGFNTPKHKINIGASGTIYKALGFTVNWRWVDDYTWESAFAPQVNPIASYNVTDLQLSYDLPKLLSTIRVGGSNIFNQEYLQATGMPMIGGFYYASWTFNVDFK